MTTQKPTFIRVQLSLVEELLKEIVEHAVEDGYASLAYLSGKLEGAIEGAISPVPQDYFDSELTEAQQRLKERILDC